MSKSRKRRHKSGNFGTKKPEGSRRIADPELSEAEGYTEEKDDSGDGPAEETVPVSYTEEVREEAAEAQEVEAPEIEEEPEAEEAEAPEAEEEAEAEEAEAPEAEEEAEAVPEETEEPETPVTEEEPEAAEAEVSESEEEAESPETEEEPEAEEAEASESEEEAESPETEEEPEEESEGDESEEEPEEDRVPEPHILVREKDKKPGKDKGSSGDEDGYDDARFIDELEHSKHTRRGSRIFNILVVPEDGRRVRSVKTSADVLGLLLLIIIAMFLSLVIYFIQTASVRDSYNKEIKRLGETITTLSEDKIVLQAEVERLEQELTEANNAISEKQVQALAANEEQALLSIPSTLPLDTGSLPSEYDKERHCITFEVGGGAHVVSAGDGKVTYAGESVEAGGYLVTVDHGNGYECNFYCQSEPVVKEGAEIKRGTVLFKMEGADSLIYQIKYEGDFIDPYTVLNIAG